MTKEQKIEHLRRYFENQDDVVMAFVFGSQAKGYAREHSDWDIAVYLTNEDRDRELSMWSTLEGIVGAEVDLVVLNRASASIAWSAMRSGIALAINDRRAYLRQLLSVSLEANDWYYTAHLYHRIFERSASLSEEDRERLERTLQFLEEEVREFSVFEKLSWEEYADEKSKTKKREVERWAEQLVNACILVAEIVLASERVVIPETYRRMVERLGIIKPFDVGDFSKKLAAWTELKNLLAHEYLDYRWKEISVFIQTAGETYRTLVVRLREFLQQ
ncbi:MAG: nucleotidyltransferase domain-containing protein [Parcubacteria group bacterium Gr01-1014_48]|nr:MAG: nucleotidyltransferase domain-containing protein [Parcubacteria group bacterium Greene0416_14]TSC74167.1 MAG: nucleotidyltransferase domain-containing protein [Parcubacteria group bacterium Gr01-1014_48]TSD00843.1 MAG: nucleotidyltransferase domain-containing protein [Parcubacteria group bacterium Greene1014_15]TSD07925.1 MAG: nucleotidyltransferase domain-containing protein [Parcubacteria group bacterium Greene0714_4]